MMHGIAPFVTHFWHALPDNNKTTEKMKKKSLLTTKKNILSNHHTQNQKEKKKQKMCAFEGGALALDLFFILFQLVPQIIAKL